MVLVKKSTLIQLSDGPLKQALPCLLASEYTTTEPRDVGYMYGLNQKVKKPPELTLLIKHLAIGIVGTKGKPPGTDPFVLGTPAL